MWMYKSSILNECYVAKVENHFQIKLVLNSYLNILYLPDQQTTNMIIFWLSYFGSLGMWWHFYTTQEAVLYITVCLHLFIICSVRISKFWLFKSSFAYIYCDIYILLLTSFICIVMQKSTCFIVNKPRCNHLSSLHIKQPPESQFSNHLHLAVTHSTQRWKK